MSEKLGKGHESITQEKSKTEIQNKGLKIPPEASKNLFSDLKFFFFNKPDIPTLIKFATREEREQFSQRIMQRTGIEVSSYSIMNLHKIGIEAPVQYVFEELLKWDGDSTCWPNNLAKVSRIDNQLESIKILLFGKKRLPFGIFSPLFKLSAIRIQRAPTTSDYDNARYLLYKCSGGYPIGIFSIYVRSSIEQENEKGQAQLFMGVGFDFYGRKTKFKYSPLSFIWEAIHDRVTTNVLNRLKQLSEWRFEKIQSGIK